MTASPWLIHTGWVAGRSECSCPPETFSSVRPYSLVPVLCDRAAERLGHRLEAVADAEHRHTEVEQRGIQLRSAVGVHAGRPAGQHDGLRILGLDLLDARGVRDDLRIHPRLADAAGDQLRVLRAEVDHQDGAGRC